MPQSRSLSFGSQAALYDDSRPSYPLAAVEWVIEPVDKPNPRVVDLAAGTGKLTEVLLSAGARVTAVEPDAAMSAVIAKKLPEVEVLIGRDSDIPLPSDSIDAVCVAQAWHWFTPAAASQEIGRVLHQGGVLGIIWNTYDESFPWVAQLVSLLRTKDTRDCARNVPVVSWGTVEEHEISWSWERTPEQIVDLARSTSWVIMLPSQDREEMCQTILELARDNADPATGTVTLPYITKAYRCVRP